MQVRARVTMNKFDLLIDKTCFIKMYGNGFREGDTLEVVMNYAKQNYDDLDLVAGDIVVLLPWDEQCGNLFLKGVNRQLGPNNGQEGYFPASVVKSMDERRDRSTSFDSQRSQASEAIGEVEEDTQNFTEDEYVAYMESKVHIGSMCRVRYKYEAQRADELDLEVGDLVAVAQAPQGGWWKGALFTEQGLGKLGWFPCNFLEILPEPKPETQKKSKGKKHSTAEPSSASSTMEKKSFWKRGVARKNSNEKSTESEGEGEEGGRKRSTSFDIGRSSKSSVSSGEGERERTFSQSNLNKKVAEILTFGKSKISTPESSKKGLRKNESNSSTGVGGISSFLGIGQASPLMQKSDLKTNDTVGSTSAVNEEEKIALINSLPKKLTKKSWKEGIPKDQIDKLSAKDQMLQQVLWELFVTEGGYVRDMKMVVELFMKPLVEKKIISAKDSEAIFSNIEKIISVNEAFYNTFERFYESSPIIDQFGSFFLKSCETFAAYTVYCRANQKAMAKIKDLLVQNEAFSSFVKEASQRSITRHLDLQSYLLKPLQRITKYPALILEILRNTPKTHPDRRNLEISLAKMQNILVAINDGIDGVQKIADIQNSFDEKITLTSPTRYFVREDSILLSSSSPDHKQKLGQLFLFNDLIILAKKDWRDKNRLVEKAYLSDFRVNDEALDPASSTLELSFDQDSDGNNSNKTSAALRYSIVFETKSKRDNWLQAWKSISTF